MKKGNMFLLILASIVCIGLAAGLSTSARAHCDTMSGPVVMAARQALKTGNVNLVLVWVQPADENAIREEFNKARAARKAGGAAKDTADQRFFEALVRIHRTGEGAPFTGIKPAGTDVGPAVPAADRTLETGSAEALQKLVGSAVETGIQRHFQEALERRRYDPNDVAAGRAFVKAYIEYTHFVEKIYGAATSATGPHEHGEGE
ncbi:MAG: DUF6448 family protein [Pseudomonadota bacterium]